MCSCAMNSWCVVRVVTSFIRELRRALRWLNVLCVALSPWTLKSVGFFYRVCEMEVAKEEGVVSMADECLEKAGDNRMVGVTKVAAIGAEIKIERMDEVGVVM